MQAVHSIYWMCLKGSVHIKVSEKQYICILYMDNYHEKLKLFSCYQNLKLEMSLEIFYNFNSIDFIVLEIYISLKYLFEINSSKIFSIVYKK